MFIVRSFKHVAVKTFGRKKTSMHGRQHKHRFKEMEGNSICHSGTDLEGKRWGRGDGVSMTSHSRSDDLYITERAPEFQ